MEPINPEPKPGEYVLPWSADDSREFVGASLDPRFDAVSTFALSSKPPRASHPVFGPVPRGRLVLTEIDIYKIASPNPSDLAGALEPRMFREQDISRVSCGADVHPSLPKDCARIMVRINEHCYTDPVVVRESPAEVSRLIAEAQGDGA